MTDYTDELLAAMSVLATHAKACNNMITFERTYALLNREIIKDRGKVNNEYPSKPDEIHDGKTCQTCRQFSPVKTGSALGFCNDHRVQKLITSFEARNCDGFGYEERIVIDNGDNGVRL